MNTSNPDKRTLYKTARARIACAHFKAGDIVSIKAWHKARHDDSYFFICNNVVAYPQHHLTDFVL